ncbi:unnamed protein product, partial [Mesorhabditis spiculigera]
MLFGIIRSPDQQFPQQQLTVPQGIGCLSSSERCQVRKNAPTRFEEEPKKSKPPLGSIPPSNVSTRLDPKEQVLVAVSCDSFQSGAEDTNNDRVTIEWTNTPDGAAKQFRREWFQGDGMVRRKNLPIEYNP